MTYLLKCWLVRVVKFINGCACRKPRRRANVSQRLALEALEERMTPSANLVADINPGPSGSGPQYLTNINGTLFFAANDGVHGDELWKSNGTAAGTVMVKDINPGPGSSYPQYLTNVNGELFFQATDGTHGYELWESNGTAAGTVMVKDINPGVGSSFPKYLTNVNGELFFQATDGTHGYELWQSNGTAAGTVMVKDINPGIAGSYPKNLTNVNGTLFFSANDGADGYELWESSGTAAGTFMVKDINSGSDGSYPKYLTNVNGTLFFSANDGVHGYQLWECNGTAAGTMMVADINPSAGSYPKYLTNVNGTLFFSANDGTHGYELWESNGTAAGTFMVKDIHPGAAGSYPQYLTNFNGTLFFQATDGTHGYELWQSDGASGGTQMVKDINPGPASSYPQYLTNANGTLFFAANDGVDGFELWQSDGTADGTALAAQIAPGSGSGNPNQLTVIGNSLFFVATDPTHGAELWEFNIGSPVVTLQPVNQMVDIGTTATFTTSAVGNPVPTVQWQVSADGGATWTNISGATSTTLTLTNVTQSQSGDEYEAVFTNNLGTATSNPATLTLDTPPAITLQPVSETVNAGKTATFVAAASGTPAPTVQWQVSADGGISWTDVSGATFKTLTFNKAAVAQNGDEYEAVFSNSLGTATTNPATLTVDSAPVVTMQPVNQTANVGATATFTAAASGNPAPTVQWQVSANGGISWTNISGATSPTLTLINVAAAQNSDEYRAVFSNSLGTATTSSVTLTVDTPPVVSFQPVNLTVFAGDTVSFNAAASGNPAPTAQWQVSSNGGISWTNIGGAMSTSVGEATFTTLTLTNVTAAQNGDEYEAVFSNSLGMATTNPATLTVDSAPAVTMQPVNQTANVGATASFVAAAGGNPAPTVQWQVSANGGINWTNISGATSATLTLSNVAAAQNGDEYRAVFSNSLGTATTSSAKLTVDTAPAVTTQPVSQTVNAGKTATFTAAASGNPAPTVQWQVSANGGISWTNVSGATSPTLTLTNVTAAQNGDEYRAVFTNSLATATTKSATLTVDTAPAVTTQPVNQTANVGATATFTAAASGNPAPAVQWQVSTNGGISWTSISGATSPTLTLTNVTKSQNGYEYQAIFSNSLGMAATNPATLTVDSAPVVTAQPVSKTVNAGATATFTAAASGNPAPTVQWQVSANEGVNWTNVSGATSTTLTLTNVAAAQNGDEYRAVFTNSLATATTNSATLTVNSAPAVTLQPVNQTVNAGATATFTAAAGGNPAPTVQWQVSGNGGISWTNISGATSATLMLTNVIAAQNGDEYQAVFTNMLGTATTNAATLTVDTAPVVTLQPVNQAVSIGATATFTASASGNPAPSVQWQVSTDGGATWTNVSGATSTTLTVPTVTAAQAGDEYQAVFTNSVAAVASNAAALNGTAPAMMTQPLSQTVDVGLTATFTAAASGNPAPSVQWQVSANGGVSFTPISGATATTLTLLNVTAAQNGFEYEAVFTSVVGSVTSNSATLTVDAPPAITTQPQAQFVNIGSTATFTAAAGNVPTPTVQWYVSVDAGTTFTSIVGATSTTLTVPNVSLAQDGDEYEAVFTNALGSAPTAPTVLAVLRPFANVSVAHGATPAPTVGLSVLDPSPTGPVNYTVSLLDPLLALKTKFGLTLQDGFFDDRGQNEKYLLSTNGSNPAGSGYFVLMPSGNLYAYVPDANNDLNATLAVAPVASVAPSVYQNPSLLTANLGAPIVTSGTNPLYNLKIQLGLVNPVTAASFNSLGDDEQHLQSSNGSNRAGQGAYLLLPNNELYAWGGSLAASQLVANFNAAPYSTNVYANPALLTGAVLPTAVGVAYSTTANAGGTLTLTPAPGFDRSVAVTVTATDSTHSHSQALTFTVADVIPSIAPLANLPVNQGAAVPAVPLVVNDPDPDSTLRTFSVAVSGYNPLYDLQAQLGLTKSDIAADFDARHQNEKYFLSTNGSNPAGFGYFVLMPTDELFAYVPDAQNDLMLTLANPPASNFTQAPYSPTENVYNDTALLFNASTPASPTVAANRGPLDDVRTVLGLTAPDQSQYFDLRGQNEKYLQSTNGSNPAGGGYYVLMPTDKLYAYVADTANDLVATLASAPVVDFNQPQFASAGNVYAEPSLLYAAAPAFINDPVYSVQQSFGLNMADLSQVFNKRDLKEKYLHSANGSNPAGAGYFVLMPSDELYAFVPDAANDLAATLSNAPVADFAAAPYSTFLGAGNVYSTPSLLYADTDQTAAVTATVNASGVVTIVPNIAFTGTVRITATVSDGAEVSSQSFLFTVNDQAPAIAPITASPVMAASGASTTINFSPSTFGSAPGLQAASFANPFASMQQQYGLTTSDIAADLNARHQNEKYFLSSNGSNPAGKGYYVLMPTDKLYAYVQDTADDLAATLAAAPVADFSQAPFVAYGNVYATTALLYGAMQPPATITTSFPSVGSLMLNLPPGYVGSFTLTIFVGDGALETQQQWLIQVS
jgi:ELWxxDGT repeat protein